jgi:hypothetical protein
MKAVKNVALFGSLLMLSAGAFVLACNSGCVATGPGKTTWTTSNSSSTIDVGTLPTDVLQAYTVVSKYVMDQDAAGQKVNLDAAPQEVTQAHLVLSDHLEAHPIPDLSRPVSTHSHVDMRVMHKGKKHR